MTEQYLLKLFSDDQIQFIDENVEKIKEYYPELNVQQYDLDTNSWEFGKWDIIINFGLYYHLENLRN